jgi:hypothetical protein
MLLAGMNKRRMIRRNWHETRFEFNGVAKPCQPLDNDENAGRFFAVGVAHIKSEIARYKLLATQFKSKNALSQIRFALAAFAYSSQRNLRDATLGAIQEINNSPFEAALSFDTRTGAGQSHEGVGTVIPASLPTAIKLGKSGSETLGVQTLSLHEFSMPCARSKLKFGLRTGSKLMAVGIPAGMTALWPLGRASCDCPVNGSCPISSGVFRFRTRLAPHSAAPSIGLNALLRRHGLGIRESFA